jgi:PadR family transcriptional regulator PadR
MTRSNELLQGTLDLLILKVLTTGPMHGFGIADRVRRLSGDVLRVNQSALYPALHRLEHQAWIKAEWGESENNRRAKFYSLTKAGRARLTGLCLGMVVAVAFAQSLRGFLYEVPALDPLTFALVPALLFIATLACLIPSARAATTDPMVAFRHE